MRMCVCVCSGGKFEVQFSPELNTAAVSLSWEQLLGTQPFGESNTMCVLSSLPGPFYFNSSRSDPPPGVTWNARLGSWVNIWGDAVELMVTGALD